MFLGCTHSSGQGAKEDDAEATLSRLSPGLQADLRDSLTRIVADCPGEIGVALIVNNADTIAINDDCIYPMMSVFKLHQAIAVGEFLDRSGISRDSILMIKRDDLDLHTWSPMLKDYTESEFGVSIGELLKYTLSLSDNNASNLLFERIVSVHQTDSLIARLIPRRLFSIQYTEKEMSADHARAYPNCTSPSGGAMLINRLFTDSVISADNQDFIRRTMEECKTGADRIIAPLIDREGVKFAHKTGSGYVDHGKLVAHNDVAYITLPNGVRYSLAVFVKDFSGTEAEASAAIARISGMVYDALGGL